MDVVDTLWTTLEGDQAIDLDGASVGSIYQDVMGLTLGTSYVVSFLMYGNDAGDPTIKTMDVSAGATTTGIPSTTATAAPQTDSGPQRASRSRQGP